MIILSHRGLWTEPQQRNTLSAMVASFEKGFGVETDVRDFDGNLVISHDMPSKDALPLRSLLIAYDAAGRPGRLALNIKADGLAPALAQEVGLFPGLAKKVFVFDMSVPDMLHYFDSGLQVFTRHSEYEPTPPLEARSDGLWMDCFVRPWVDPIDATNRLASGQNIAIVSPELHKRASFRLSWHLLRDALRSRQFPQELTANSLMLCTDFPEEAADFFDEGQK